MHYLLPGMFHIKPIITVSWSLSYEIFYYLSLPILISLLRIKSWNANYRIMFFIFVSVFYLYLCANGISSRPRLAMFISGILLYEITKHGKEVHKKIPCPSIMATVVFIISIIYFGRLSSGSLNLGNISQVSGNIYATAIVFITFIFFVKIGMEDTTLNKKLSFKPLRYLGNMSYSYYLIHGLTIKGIGFLISTMFPLFSFSGTTFWLFAPLVFFSYMCYRNYVVCFCRKTPLSLRGIQVFILSCHI